MDPDNHKFFWVRNVMVGRDGAIGIATLYRLDDPGIESRWEWHFPQPCKFAPEPTQPRVHWVPGLFPAGKSAGVWRWPPTPYSAKVKERVNVYLRLFAFLVTTAWTLFSKLAWKGLMNIKVVWTISTWRRVVQNVFLTPLPALSMVILSISITASNRWYAVFVFYVTSYELCDMVERPELDPYCRVPVVTLHGYESTVMWRCCIYAGIRVLPRYE